jgi:hypothetical protein
MNQEQQSADDWSELWATFSVKDHVRASTFVAEVLVYDKLLIPVVPTRADGLSDAEANREWRRWEEQGWDPARQTQLVALLKDRVEIIPWTAERQSDWQQSMAAEFNSARRNGYFTTGTVLQRFAPAMARTVVAVPQYTSLEDLEASAGIRRRQNPHEPVAANNLLAVLGFELLVPENPEQDDFGALRQAVEVASDPAYRDARRALFAWQRRFFHGDQTDARSIKAAVGEMSGMVADLRKANRMSKIWKGFKHVFAFAGASSKVAALAPPVAALAPAGAAIATVGSFVVDAAQGTVPGMPAATLIADARERLGLD